MKQKISAIILAGGQGRRFNHQDKGLIAWRGKRLISHVIDRVKPQVNQIIICCNRNIETYQALGYPLCQDRLPDYQGPLAGIQAGLVFTQHPFSLICPCDTPNLPENLVNVLLAALIENHCDVAYPQSNNRSHYLPTLIRSDTRNSLNDYLKQKDRSMKGWYNTLKAIAVPVSAKNNAFFNLNSPDLLD